MYIYIIGGRMAVQLKDIGLALNLVIPKEDSWCREMYGIQGTPDLAKKINKVLFCVTPTFDVERYAKDNNYDAIISHHPIPLVGDYGIPHFIYHTALDCCKGGLNDMWRDALGLQNSVHFDKNLGWVGKVDPISPEDLIKKVESFTGTKIQGHNAFACDVVTSIAICTGLGGLVTDSLSSFKPDCYIVGEDVRPPEDTIEMGINGIIEVGHTVSENIGVKLIRKALEPLGVQVDLANADIDYFGNEVYNKRSAVWGGS